MKKDIPSYELCKKLKELGYETNDIHYYYDDNKEITHFLTKDMYSINCLCIAPTAGEMMDVLPHYIEYKDTYGWLKITKSDKCYVFYEIIEDIIIKFDDKSPPNALAKMLIRVIENNHIYLTGPKSNVK